LYVLRRNGKRFDLTPRLELPLGDYYHRVTLEEMGKGAFGSLQRSNGDKHCGG